MKTLRFLVFTFILTLFVSLSFSFAQQEDHPPLVLVPEGPVDSDRLVRLVYLIPNDRKPQPNIDAKLDRLIKEIQQFYADEMKRHGHSRTSFRFEADEDGNAIVHQVNGRFDDAYYQIKPTDKIDAELREHFDRYNKGIYLICVEISSDTFDDGAACGYGGSNGFSGYAYIPASGNCFEDYTFTAHELGHAFGLHHDFRNQSNIMSYGWIRNELSECAALNLTEHPYFNPDKARYRNFNTRINLLSSKFDATPPYALRLRFEISDPDGLVQAELLTRTTVDSVTKGFPEIVTCKALSGVSENVELVTREILNDVLIQVTDRQGNSWQKTFDIDFTALTPETSPVVHIPDAGLAAAIRDHLDYPSGKQITSFDMGRLAYLNASRRGITDLTGLEQAVEIESLDISNNKIKDFTPILALSELRRINIRLNPITDLTQISELTQLTRLSAGGSQNMNNIAFLANVTPSLDITDFAIITPLVDITPLAKLTQLTELYLDGNEISDLTPLANLTQLEKLFLGSNEIRDLTPLTNLTALKWLKLSKNQIRDVTPLRNMTRLLTLNLQFNQMSDTRPLKGLVELRVLYIDSNPLIDDITGLENMTQLKNLQLPSPLITDLTPLRRLTNLVELYTSDNQISDITPLADLTKLKVLSIYSNQITDLTPLANLTQLQELNLLENQIVNTSPLMGLVNLKTLYIRGNPITDLQPLLTLKRRAPEIEIYHARHGKPLPVTLSSFKATRTANGAILNWITESEVDNAGFNILRSNTKTGEFQQINVKLIQGAGTTGERSTYTWTDTTAKPNTVYYYQIEDVSYAGVHQTLTTTRLRGLVSAKGKMTTQWAEFKKGQ